jgi:hypothetical protein
MASAAVDGVMGTIKRKSRAEMVKPAWRNLGLRDVRRNNNRQ